MSGIHPIRRSVAIGGLGAIGYTIAEWLDRHPGESLRLDAVSARDLERARLKVAQLARPPKVVAVEELGDSEIVVEAAGAEAFEAIAIPAIDRGRTLIVASVGALLARTDLIERAARSGARIIVPSGALAGLDAIRAAAIGRIDSVTLETRKRPSGFAGAPYVTDHEIDVFAITHATCIFRGNAGEAARGFPANANVAAALALAGIGIERTQVELWADPGVAHNTHLVRVAADCGKLTLQVESLPSPTNPRTSRIAPQSIIACLRGIGATLAVGS
jgi:aspartate dehydrogenase